MHRQFRSLLDQARGYSEFVIVANVDIRGFSDFSLGVDSAQTALFVRRVYARLIDSYFKDAAYVKPTGDGLLVVLGFEDDLEDLTRVARKSVADAFNIVETFADICADDPMINFTVPQNVGIGLARGPASKIISGEFVLDYSGRTLNLASRLMDVARPAGVVIDGSFGLQLLDEATQGRFESAEVYIRGVAPREPARIYYSAEFTKIGASYLRPLETFRWRSITRSESLAGLEQISPFIFDSRMSLWIRARRSAMCRSRTCCQTANETRSC